MLLRVADNDGMVAEKNGLDIVLFNRGHASTFKGDVEDEKNVMAWLRNKLQE